MDRTGKFASQGSSGEPVIERSFRCGHCIKGTVKGKITDWLHNQLIASADQTVVGYTGGIGNHLRCIFGTKIFSGIFDIGRLGVAGHNIGHGNSWNLIYIRTTGRFKGSTGQILKFILFGKVDQRFVKGFVGKVHWGTDSRAGGCIHHSDPDSIISRCPVVGGSSLAHAGSAAIHISASV